MPGGFTNNLDRFLDEGVEGLLSLALTPDNAEAVRRGFYRASIGATRRRRWGACWNCPRALSMRAPPWFTCRRIWCADREARHETGFSARQALVWLRSR
jgi:hypothetical protein